jgi:hypothetical protein
MEDNFDIQHLVETKNFEALNASERSLVLKEITAEEFTQRRDLLLNTCLFLQESVKKAQPNDSYKESISAIMNSRKTKQKYGVIRSIILFRIPLYYPVAAAILLMFMFPYFYSEKKSEKEIAQVTKEVKRVIVYKTDSVIVEKNVPTYVKVPVIKYVEIVKEKSLNIPSGLDVANTFEVNNVAAMSAPNTIVFAKEQFDAQIKNIGKSSTDSEHLNKFLVVAR